MDKPIVRYTGKAVLANVYGDGTRAFLTPVDHPNHMEGHSVSNHLPVTTSLVLSHDEATGRIETKNTIYMPAEVAPAEQPA